MNILNAFVGCVNKALKRIQCFRQHHYWYKLYSRNVKNLGGNVLTNEQKRAIAEFFKPYIRVNSLTHEFHTLASGEFKVNYIPAAVYYAHVDPFYNDWDAAKHFDNKCLYGQLFPNAPQPATIAYRMNGYWFDGNNTIITEEDAVKTIARCDVDCYIKKAKDSSGGKGVIFVPQTKTVDDVKRHIDAMKGDLIVQEGIKQSKVLSAINASSVNTMRVLTLLKRDGTVKIYSAALRMGVGGSKVDNASSGGIIVGIEDDGHLKPVAYNLLGHRFDNHPTSCVKFSEFSIPNFNKVKELAKSQATRFSHFRLVSWDIALNQDDEPILIEANLYFGGLETHQLSNGPVFGDDTEEILKEVFSKKQETP